MITVMVQQETADRDGKIAIFDKHKNRLATFAVKCIDMQMGNKSKVSLVQTSIVDEEKVKVNN